MGAKNQNGFTIVEITLFLAVAMMLLVFLMSGITIAVARQHFSDGVNSTQSFIQQQFSEAQNSINTRAPSNCSSGNLTSGSQVRGASDCIILGKLIELNDSNLSDNSNTLTAYTVIAGNVDVTAAPYSSMTELQLLASINPVVLNTPSTRTRYVMPWDVTTGVYKDSDSLTAGDEVRYIGLIQSPRSGVLHIYKVGGSIGTSNLASPSQQLAPSGVLALEPFANQSIKACISSPEVSSDALITVAPSGSQDGVTTHFDDGLVEIFGC